MVVCTSQQSYHNCVQLLGLQWRPYNVSSISSYKYFSLCNVTRTQKWYLWSNIDTLSRQSRVNVHNTPYVYNTCTCTLGIEWAEAGTTDCGIIADARIILLLLLVVLVTGRALFVLYLTFARFMPAFVSITYVSNDGGTVTCFTLQ